MSETETSPGDGRRDEPSEEWLRTLAAMAAADAPARAVPEAWRDVAEGRASWAEAELRLRQHLGEAELQRDRAFLEGPTPEERRAFLERITAANSAPPRGSSPRRSRALGWSLGLAAALLLSVLGVQMLGSDPAPLSPYAIELGGSARTLGVEPAPRRFALDERLHLRALPQRAVEGPLRAQAWLRADGGPVRAVPASAVAVHGQGAITIEGTLGTDLEVEPGRWTLHLEVGRPDACDDERSTAECQRMAVELEIEPRGGHGAR